MNSPSPSPDTGGARKSNLLTVLVRNYAGSVTGAVLSVLSAWMIVTGIKDGLGFELSVSGALADLIGIGSIAGIAYWLRLRFSIR